MFEDRIYQALGWRGGGDFLVEALGHRFNVSLILDPMLLKQTNKQTNRQKIYKFAFPHGSLIYPIIQYRVC